MILLALIAVSLPALFGASLSYLLARKIGRKRCRDLDFVSCGVGITLGYIFVARLMWQIDQANQTVFSWTNLYILFTVTLALIVWAIWAHFRDRRKNKLLGLEAPSRRSADPLLKLTLATLCSISIVQVFLAPVSAWDAIDWWVASADRFIAVDTQLLPQFIWDNFNYLTWDPYPYYDWASQEPVSFDDPFPYEHYHPITISLIAAYAAIWSYEFNAINLNMLPWVYCWLSIFLIIRGLMAKFRVNKNVSLLVAYFAISAPLFENHFTLAGYAEIWMTAVSLGSLSLISIGHRNADYRLLMAGIGVAFSCIWIKNSGFIFVITILAATCLLAVNQLKLKHIALSTFIILSLLLYVFSYGYDFTLGGTRWAVLYGEDVVIHLAGRSFAIEVANVLQVARNLLWAIFINSSYSVLGLAWIMVSIHWAVNARRWRDLGGGYFASGLVFFYFSSLLFLFLLVSQLIWPLALQVATVGSDTANSRYHIPVFITMLTFATLVFFGRSEPSDTSLQEATASQGI